MCLRSGYSDLDYSKWLYSYAFFRYDSCIHNFYASSMDNFDSEYPFGTFLEDSKFDELSKFLQSHCQKKISINTMAEIKVPMHALIF